MTESGARNEPDDQSEPDDQTEREAARGLSGDLETPAEVRQEAILLERAIGGWRGIIDSGLPTAVFVVAYIVTSQDLRTSLIAAIAAGVVIVIWRLIRREPLGQVLAGFVGLAISAWWASRNDNASDIYIPGMLTNLGYGTGVPGLDPRALAPAGRGDGLPDRRGHVVAAATRCSGGRMRPPRGSGSGCSSAA